MTGRSNNPRAAASDSLTRNERAILDLWDAGHGTRAIARRLSLHKRYVDKCLHYVEGDETRRARRAIIAGSARLAAAIVAARNEQGKTHG